MKIYHLILSFFIIIVLTGCFNDKDVIVKSIEKPYLKKYGNSEDEIVIKFKKDSLNNKIYFLIEKENFKEIVIFIKELKSNLKKYELQVDVYNKKE